MSVLGYGVKGNQVFVELKLWICSPEDEEFVLDRLWARVFRRRSGAEEEAESPRGRFHHNDRCTSPAFEMEKEGVVRCHSFWTPESARKLPGGRPP